MMNLFPENHTVVLVHGAWADGSAGGPSSTDHLHTSHLGRRRPERESAPGSEADVASVRMMGSEIDDQNYKLSGDLDLAKYRSVSVWCKRSSVNFATAALRMTETSQNR
jgi:hypothetical protein